MGLRIGLLSDKLFHYYSLVNPCIIIMAVSIFNFFNRSINKIASLSLLIYIIYENILFVKVCLEKI